MAMTEVMFYRDLTGELKVQKEEEERVARDYVNPMFDSYSQNEQPQEDQTHPQQFWSVTGDSSVASDENKEVQNNAASENTQDSLYGSVEIIERHRITHMILQRVKKYRTACRVRQFRKRKKITNQNHGMNTSIA